MREEYELEVLEQYDIEVKGTRRVRGAFFCDTQEGTMLLKETKMSGGRALLMYRLLDRLETEYGLKTDTPRFTREGHILSVSADGKTYMLKKWFRGKECDIRQEEDLIRAASELALFHKAAEDGGFLELDGGMRVPVGKNPLENMRKRNRELKKVRAFVRGRTSKNEFEYLLLESFEEMFIMAEAVLTHMEESSCRQLYQESLELRSLVHGEFNYHNIIMDGQTTALTGFDHFHTGIQVDDLYYFIRKAMEKCRWKLKIGISILEAYERVRALSNMEREYLGLCLWYPEKYWKTAGAYYHSGKAWIPEKCVEKLRMAVRQSEEKNDFLRNAFSAVLP